MLRRALFLGQPYHHLDLVAAPLLPKHFRPIKGVTYLPGHITRRQPEALAFRFQREIELLFTRLEAIIHIIHPGIGCEDVRQFGARLFQEVHMAVAEFHGQRTAPASRSARVGRKAQVLHAGNFTHGLTPAPGELRRAHDRVADSGFGQFDAHPPGVAARPANVGRNRNDQFRVA